MYFLNTFFLKIDYSLVNFSDLKFGIYVFREPEYGCLGLCSGIAIFLIVFTKQADSLIHYGIIL